MSRLVLLRDLAQTIIGHKRPDRAAPQLWDELARLAGRVFSTPAPGPPPGTRVPPAPLPWS